MAGQTRAALDEHVGRVGSARGVLKRGVSWGFSGRENVAGPFAASKAGSRGVGKPPLLP